MKRQAPEKVLLFVLYFLAFLALIYYNVLTHTGEQQFVSLAKSFLQGHLYLDIKGTWPDSSFYKGYAYWPQGIFPAIILMPFVAVVENITRQGYVQVFLNILNIFLLYKIALKITKNKITSLWLSFAYIFSTAYIVVGLIPWSWWFAQVVATSALLLAIHEFLYNKRWLLTGFYLACALATRIDLFIALFFFLFSVLLSKEKINLKIRRLFLLCVPVLSGLSIVLLYNYFRFGSIFEFGYKYHIPALIIARNILHRYGTWSLFYYPTNFYYLFLKGFDAVVVAGSGYLKFPFVSANIWGMSIFLTSPILLWCFKNIKITIKEQQVKLALLTSLFILLFLLGYFGVGTRQYGYRYALDFSPFLFLILCRSFSMGMDRSAKIVIVVSFIINYLLFPSIFVVALN